MADSKKVEGRDEDDHHRPLDYIDSKREDETTGHAGDEEEGHDDDAYTDSKKGEGHDENEDRPFDYSLIVLAQVADAFLRKGCPKGYAGAGEEMTPSRGKMKLQESSSTTMSMSSTDSVDDQFWNTQLAQRWTVLKKRSRCIYSNSGEGTSTDCRLQRDNPAAGADLAEGRHQPSPAPGAPQAGRTWREVHRAMGGGDVVQLGKKTVHRSDMSTHQSRLLLNQGLEGQVYKHVLKREREEINSCKGLEVEVLNYYGERFGMRCRYRVSQKGMVFNSGWSKFLKQHDGSHLKEGESLLLLAFRTQQQRLCFVIVPQHLEDKINLQQQHD